jgi:hypothetical protein
MLFLIDPDNLHSDNLTSGERLGRHRRLGGESDQVPGLHPRTYRNRKNESCQPIPHIRIHERLRHLAW